MAAALGFLFKMPGQGRHELSTEIRDLLFEIGLGATPAVRQNKETQHRHQTGRRQTGDIGGCRTRRQRHRGTETHRADLENRRRRDGALDILRHAPSLRHPIVRGHPVAGRAADRFEQTGAIGFKATADLAHHAVGVGRGASVDVVDHVLPMRELGVDEPVDQRVDFGLDRLRSVGHDLGLESLFEFRCVEELWQPRQADGLVEELHPALFHPEEAVVDVGQPEVELPAHIRGPGFGLASDIADRLQILVEQTESGVDGCERPFQQVPGHTEGVAQLEPQQLSAVERVMEKGLNRRTDHWPRVLRRSRPRVQQGLIRRTPQGPK